MGLFSFLGMMSLIDKSCISCRQRKNTSNMPKVISSGYKRQEKQINKRIGTNYWKI